MKKPELISALAERTKLSKVTGVTRNPVTWEVVEQAEDQDGIRTWFLHVVIKGERPGKGVTPFRRGFWFFGRDGGDPAGEWLHKQGLIAANVEVERLNG